MNRRDMMPIEHEPAQLWKLSADRRSVQMELPCLAIDGLPDPITIKMHFERWRRRPDDPATAVVAGTDAAGAEGALALTRHGGRAPRRTWTGRTQSSAANRT